jgi:hypothetical protein
MNYTNLTSTQSLLDLTGSFWATVTMLATDRCSANSFRKLSVIRAIWLVICAKLSD